MKQYLWAGVALLVVGAHASDNPFELKENFGKLDQDQAVLLDELKKLAEIKELVADAALDEEPIDEIEQSIQEEAVVPLDKENENKVIESLHEVIEEPDTSPEDRLNAMRENALAASKKAFEKKNSNIELPKQEMQDTENKAEKKQEAELQKSKSEESQAIDAKQEAEKREVEAYEKQRAEKLAQEKSEAEALEKEALAQKEARAKRLAKKEAHKKQAEADAAAEKMAKAKKEHIQVTKVDKEDAEAINSVDINVTREKLEAKISADKAYEDAVKEMSQED